MLSEATALWSWPSGVVLALLFASAVAWYRLFLSPLAFFPGPLLAAVTGLYEGYYDCVKDGGGRYYLEVDRMHDVYGHVVRISPSELHIRDPEWNEIYKIGRKAHKSRWYYRPLSASGSSISTTTHEKHRIRRDALQPYFTAPAVARHEEQVQALVGQMCSQLSRLKNSGEIVNLGDVFRALATDVATSFTLRSPFGHLNHPRYEHASNAALRDFSPLGMFNRQLNGAVYALVKGIPKWLAARLQSPASDGLRNFYAQIRAAVDSEYRRLDAKACSQEGCTAGAPQDDRSLIPHLLHSQLPSIEKVQERIARECSSVTSAGTETVGSTITAVVFLLLSHPRKHASLSQELGHVRGHPGEMPNYGELVKLPYLTAVIHEGFRLHSAVSGRLARYDPKHDIVYKGMVIPRGTVVSTTQHDTNRSKDIFPSPDDFVPERWIDPSESKRLSRYLHPFGRGTRSCLGKDLAYQEIYIAIAHLFSPAADFRLRLHDTDWEEDVQMYHDYFAPFPKSRRGVRAVVLAGANVDVASAERRDSRVRACNASEN